MTKRSPRHCQSAAVAYRWFAPSSCRIALFILSPTLQILEREILVRRMRPAIGQGEPKEKRFHPENVAELRDDRNAAAFANERRLFA